MNKLVLTFIVLVGITIGGVVMYSLSQPQTPKPTPAQKVATTTTSIDRNSATQSSSRYLPYSSQIFEGTKDKKRILFFYASWCPTCIPADAAFSENASKIPEDVVVIRVNYNDPETDDEEKTLARKYGVTYQHTFVQIDMQGNQITKWNGGQMDELLANIQ